MYAMRRGPCKRCGTWTERMRHTGRPLWCHACSVVVAEQAARAMAERNGPEYDRWLESAGPKGRPAGDRKGA